MKKFALLLAAFLAAFLPAAQAESPADFYVAAATEVAEKMDAFAMSNAIKFYISDFPTEPLEIAREFGFAACHAPDRILLLEVDRAAMVDALLTEYVSEGNEVTDAEIAFATKTFTAGMIPLYLFNSIDSDLYTAIAVCTTHRSYPAPENMENDVVVLLVREDADVLIACFFGKSGEGILSEAAYYVPRTIDDLDTIERISGMTGGEVTEISVR